MTCADSSFLVSIYVDDEHTRGAKNYLRRNPHPIVLTPFLRSETQHALRLLAFRGVIAREQMTRCLLTFDQDLDEGFYEPVVVEADLVFQRVSQLSHRHALELGVRYLDMLHVASALMAKARCFLTFDDRQRELALAAGLEVRP